MAKKDLLRSALIHRLNRISGQVSGVKRMVEEQRDCSEIILQIAAIRAAIGQLGLTLVHDHMEECIQESIKRGSSKKLVISLNKVMKQMLK